jgi:hypothetical protein
MVVISCSALNMPSVMEVFQMLIVIKDVKRIKGQCYGITRYMGRKKIAIDISMELNKDLAEYGSTLLHELLHVWLVILRSNGAVINKRKEHPFIYQVERQITNLVGMLQRKK